MSGLWLTLQVLFLFHLMATFCSTSSSSSSSDLILGSRAELERELLTLPEEAGHEDTSELVASLDTGVQSHAAIATNLIAGESDVDASTPSGGRRASGQRDRQHEPSAAANGRGSRTRFYRQKRQNRPPPPSMRY